VSPTRWNSSAPIRCTCDASDVDRVNESLAGEWALLDAAVRSDESRVERLLHPDFAERGQSGRWWTREATLDALPREAGTYELPEVHDVAAQEIAGGVVLIVYVSVRAGRSVGRSSLWMEHEGRMRIRWHQGTPLPAE
jgi:ribonuclease HI